MVELDEFHAHEALDRCHMVQNIIEDHLLSHPWIESTDDVRTLIEEAAGKLADAYQLIGNKSF